MRIKEFAAASATDRRRHVVHPYEEVPVTELVPGSNSRLVFGANVTLSSLTMSAGSVFELHSHPEEQVMYVLEGHCDEVIGDRLYRVGEGDLIHLPANVKHGAFVGEVDCKIIDVFVPARSDYRKKYQEQHSGSEPRFR